MTQSDPNAGPVPSPPGDPVVAIIMGSRSDWPTMRAAAEVLAALAVPFETQVISAHRTPERMVSFAQAAEGRGLQVIVAGAGGAAHLPGMTASLTTLPVFGVPVESKALSGLDSLLSIAQMPGGVPVGTLAIGKAGAKNAAILATQILGLEHPTCDEAVRAMRAKQAEGASDLPVAEAP